jgi:dolichyl-phosphate-mannose--protein O-mannosyl transferase
MGIDYFKFRRLIYMNGIFQTSSLNIVAWLMTKGYVVKDKKRIDNSTIFYFDRDENLQKFLNEYNNNKELKSFISKFREVKMMAKN